MSRSAVNVVLSEQERVSLERLVSAPTSEQRMVVRARVVLRAAAGETNAEIAPAVGLSAHKVGQWRRRFAAKRLAGLGDRPRPGAPRRYGHDKRIEVFKTACSEPPEGETHWSARSLAERVGIGKSQTHAILAEADLKPHQVRSWLTSLDPDFDAKQADVCGLYLDPPEGAIVVSLDEKTGVQAKQPIRQEIAVAPGRPARREFEYKRHGTVALLAALLVHTGEIKGQVYERHSRVEFLDFLTPRRRDPPGQGGARDPRQPPGAQDARGRDLARAAPALEVSLHPDARLLAQPDRAVLLDPLPAPAQAGRLQLYGRPRGPAAGLHRALQPHREAVRLDLCGQAAHKMNPNYRTRY